MKTITGKENYNDDFPHSDDDIQKGFDNIDVRYMQPLPETLHTNPTTPPDDYYRTKSDITARVLTEISREIEHRYDKKIQRPLLRGGAEILNAGPIQPYMIEHPDNQIKTALFFSAQGDVVALVKVAPADLAGGLGASFTTRSVIRK